MLLITTEFHPCDEALLERLGTFYKVMDMATADAAALGGTSGKAYVDICDEKRNYQIMAYSLLVGGKRQCFSKEVHMPHCTLTDELSYIINHCDCTDLAYRVGEVEVAFTKSQRRCDVTGKTKLRDDVVVSLTRKSEVDPFWQLRLKDLVDGDLLRFLAFREGFPEAIQTLKYIKVQEAA
ncbi:MAG: hypothetical protein GJ680_18350 [Alteromonadaceae bacterium]|nr:hypothetical protein [Alteromonadaceae bacterium]